MAVTTESKDLKVRPGEQRIVNLRRMQDKTDELYSNDLELENQVADLEVAVEAAGKVNTISINGSSTKLSPDSNKNIDLPISKSTVGLGNVTNENANTIVSNHNNNETAHVDIRKFLDTVNLRAYSAYTLAEGRSRAISYISIAAAESALNAATNSQFNIGDNIFIQAKDVPDFWVAQKFETSQTGNIPDTYDDPIRLGYYGICKLETQKVDLTDLNAHKASKSNPHAVTKSQVGLGLVVNAGMDDAPAAGSGNYVKSGGVKSALDAKENAFTKNTAFNKNFGTNVPSMDGIAMAGVADTVAKSDHVHPSDSSRVPTTRKVAGKALTADVTLGSLTIAGKTYNGSNAVPVTDADLQSAVGQNDNTFAFTASEWVANMVGVADQFGMYSLPCTLGQPIAVYDNSGAEIDVSYIRSGNNNYRVCSDVAFAGVLIYITRGI